MPSPRLIHAAFKPAAFAPITSKELLETSQISDAAQPSRRDHMVINPRVGLERGDFIHADDTVQDGRKCPRVPAEF